MVKPQSAFYERFGSRGVAVLERVIATARDAGALVLLDVKRGDIGSTTQAYADAYLDPASPLASDAITASPYLGFGSLDPMVDTARRHGAGVFVLALTSNKEGPEVQHATAADGRSVAAGMLDHLRHLNAGDEPLGSFGAVVGATIGDHDGDLAINGPLLAPGYGAQGGTVADLRRIFGSAAPSVLASTSRDLLRHGPDVGALAAAARRANDDSPRCGTADGPVSLAGLLVAGVLATGCADDQERYCDAVRDRQTELSEQVGGGGATALIDGLATVRGARRGGALRHPRRVVAADRPRRGALRDALGDAGVDAATYDAERPPAGLDDADRDRIAQAARDLGADETQRALADLEQQALDVCQTPLVV